MGTPIREVDTPLARYDELLPVWEKNRAILGGERLVKAYDQRFDTTDYLLLPFSPKMDRQQYDWFLAEAELPGICTIYARMLVSGLLRKSPVLKLPKEVPEEAMDWLVNAFTRDGGTLTAFLSEIVWEEMNTSRAWIYVDYPKVNEADYKKLSKEQRDALKPYPTLWPAESIINWSVGLDSSGKEIITRLLVKGNIEAPDPNSEFHTIQVPTVWVHEVVNSLYQIRVYTKKEGKWELADLQKDFKMNGELLTQIPAYPANGCLEPQEPQLTPLVEKEKHLYNKISRRNHLLYGAATYTVYLSGDMTEEDFDKIIASGLGTIWQLPKDVKPGVLETPTQALQDMEKTIAAGIEEMAKLGIRMLTPETDQSGIALEIRNAAQTAQLGSLNERVSNTIREIIWFMIKWRYDIDLDVNQIEFSLSEDFNPTPLGADWLRLATEWYENGLIPRSIWLLILKTNDLINPEYDDEEGQLEINTDKLINRPEDTDSSGKSFEGS
jgi:Domain of unknown function (DUF4055)